MNVDATIRKALAQLEAERSQIDKKIAALRVVLSSNTGSRETAKRARVRRRRTRKPMSAAQRRAVSARMKKFWAARRKSKASKGTAKPA